MLMALESAPPPMCMQCSHIDVKLGERIFELNQQGTTLSKLSANQTTTWERRKMRRKVFYSFSQDCKEKANEIGNDDIHLTNRHFCWMAIKTKMMIYDDEDDDTSNIPRNKRNNSADDGDGHNSNDIDDGSAIQDCFP